MKIIHVLNIHIDLFSWVYGTHENIQHDIFQHEHLLPCIVLLILRMSISLHYAKQKHPGCKKRRGQSEATVIK